jgi:uncharacterized membrane protein (DUF485 family)
MSHSRQDAGHKVTTRVAWICTLATLGGYFILMLAGAFFPKQLSKPVLIGGMFSWGLLSGVAVIVLLIAVSMFFTAWCNRKEGA